MTASLLIAIGKYETILQSDSVSMGGLRFIFSYVVWSTWIGGNKDCAPRRWVSLDSFVWVSWV